MGERDLILRPPALSPEVGMLPLDHQSQHYDFRWESEIWSSDLPLHLLRWACYRWTTRVNTMTLHGRARFDPQTSRSISWGGHVIVGPPESTLWLYMGESGLILRPLSPEVGMLSLDHQSQHYDFTWESGLILRPLSPSPEIGMLPLDLPEWSFRM